MKRNRGIFRNFTLTRLTPILFLLFGASLIGSEFNFSCLEKRHNLPCPCSHPRRPRGSQSGREKGRDESFQVGAKKPLGTDSHRAISKNSSGCRLLIGHKKCFVLLCPIGEQFLLSSFCEFVHDGYRFDHGLSGSCTKEMHTVRKLSV